MLAGFLGDVLGFMEPGALEQFNTGEVGGMILSSELLFVAAVIMFLPILMVFLSLTMKYKAARWANVILALGLFVFDLVGLPTYKGVHRQFLIAAGMGFNALTIWYAWRWKGTADMAAAAKPTRSAL
jgi:hypothetical protein